MQKAFVILALLAIISQARVFPVLSGGSNSPPGAGNDGAPNPYNQQTFFPTPGASSSSDDAETRTRYNAFENANKKNYDNSEDTYRFGVFKENYKKIKATNSDPSKTWK